MSVQAVPLPLEDDLPGVHREYLMAALSWPPSPFRAYSVDPELLDGLWLECEWTWASEDNAEELKRLMRDATLTVPCVHGCRHHIPARKATKRRPGSEATSYPVRVTFTRLPLPPAIWAAHPTSHQVYWVANCHRCKRINWVAGDPTPVTKSQ